MEDFQTILFINAPKETVWRAFVEPNQFFMAYYAANISSSFEIGDRIEYTGLYEGQETIHIYGEVLEYEKDCLLSYTDHPGPMYQSNHAELKSRVIITFESMGAATKLKLVNDQFSPNNPMQAEAKQWNLILSNFKTWVESGQLINTNKQ